MAAIDISGLVKTFGHVRALDGLDLTVEAGEVHGFLGPNGAGKSTTIRVLLGLLRADGGEVRLLGGDPWADAVELHRRLAYVPGDVNLWPNLTGGEAIDLLGRLRGGIDPARRAGPDRALRARPDQEGPHLLQGQPAEGGAGRRPGVRRRAAAARRADLRARPAQGDGLPGVDRGGPAGRAHRAALQPHPGRGRGAVRPREHHPRGQDRGDRQPRRPAAPHPHGDRRRDRRASPPASRRWPACTTSRSTNHRARFDVDTAQLDEALRHLSAARRAHV